ncbi:MAG: helicase [Planctomycetaceae bacterium]|nr:helicase [Planctomycetaceae bacterium]
MIPSVDDVFQEQGLIGRRLKQYESRPQQLDMAYAVRDAIESEEHLVVEAGTGVGKSFGYLVPCILAAAKASEQKEGRKRIVVSTHTISLQEQLIRRDIPFLNAVLPVEFSAVLVKGRGNYISLRRMQMAAERGKTLFEDEESRQFARIREWSRTTNDGSLADLDFFPMATVWDEVRSEHGNCLGKKCPTYSDCFYYQARRRVWNADLLVVNHALFFSDLALRREGASVLPDYDVAVFDEAHTLEDVAASHLGVSLSDGQFTYLFNKLYNDHGAGRGLFVQHNLREGQHMVARLRVLTDILFDDLNQWRERHSSPTVRVRRELEIENPVSPDLRDLSHLVRTYAAELEDEAQKIELRSAADRLDFLSSSLVSWLKQRHGDSVYWMETTGKTRPITKLMSSPIDVGTTLRDEMFNEIPTVIMTSATLAVGQEDFSFFRDRVGLTKANELKLGSPFDYRSQVQLILPDNMPDPGANPAQFELAVIEQIQEQLAEADGGAFVLFTSYRMLQNCARQLQGWFSRRNQMLLCQGSGLQRSALLERFRKDGSAVLFGTETFWQGIDVPGDALKTVIITKLPFSVPDHPLLEARVERIRERGGNPFVEYQVPEAAIKLRQGFGRLIRTAQDTGRVIILDPRVRTKAYGRIFLDSLPDCQRVISRSSQ